MMLATVCSMPPLDCSMQRCHMWMLTHQQAATVEDRELILFQASFFRLPQISLFLGVKFAREAF